MKKAIRVILMFIAVLSCTIFSACKNKYDDLSMTFISVDGTELKDVNLVYDEKNAEPSIRLAVRFDGIKQKEIGEVVVYSAPNERVYVKDYTYSENYCFVTVEANIVGTGDLVAVHLNSNKKYSIPITVKQKAKDVEVADKNYIISIPQTGTNSHYIDIASVAKVKPANSADKIYFSTENFIMPTGVTLITEMVEGGDFIVGFMVSENVDPGETVELFPVSVFEGYDPLLHTEKKITIEFAKLLTKEQVVLTANRVYTNPESPFEELQMGDQTIYLVANDQDNLIDKNGNIVGNHNNIKLNVKYLNAENEISDISGVATGNNFLRYYDIVLPKDDLAISKNMLDSDTFVVTANIETDKIVSARVCLTPKKEFIGQITTVETGINIQGVTKPDTIDIRKNDVLFENGEMQTDILFGKPVLTYTSDIYDYYKDGNGNGALFTFKSVVSSKVKVYNKFENMQIMIRPELLYVDAEASNIYSNENFDSHPLDIIFDHVETGSAEFVIHLHKGNSLLKFYYDDDESMLVSETFTKTDKIYMKYTPNAEGSVKANDFGLYLKNVNAATEAYLQGIETVLVSLKLERETSIDKTEIFAGRYYYDGMKFERDDYEQDVTTVYLDRSKGLDKFNKDTENDFNPKYLHVKSLADKNGDELNYSNFDIEVVPQFESVNPLKIKLGIYEMEAGLYVDGVLRGDSLINFAYQKLTDNFVGLGFDNTTDLGNYKIVISQTDDTGSTIYSRSINVVVYQGIDVDDISFSIKESQHIIKNTNEAGASYIYDDYKADYIVGAGESFDVSVHLKNEESLNMVSSYILDLERLSYYSDTVDPVHPEWGNYFKNEHEDAAEYLSIQHKSSNENKAVFTAIKGSYLSDPHYVTVAVGVNAKKYSNIITADRDEPIIVYLNFFVYDKIKEQDISINETSVTKYGTNLGAYYQDEDKLELTISMIEDLWKYVPYYNLYNKDIENNLLGLSREKTYKTLWTAEVWDGSTKYGYDDAKLKVITQEQTYNVINLKFDRAVNAYTVKIRAIVQQFNTPYTFDCDVVVENPCLTDRLVLNSELADDGVVNLKVGSSYTVDVTQIGEDGKDVSFEGVVLAVVNQYGTMLPASEVLVNQTTKTITLQTINASNGTCYLMIIAKDVLKAKISEGASGFNSISSWLINSNAYLRIELDMIDGTTVQTAYKIYNETDFWDINNTNVDNAKTAYYELINNVYLSRIEEIKDFEGTIFSNGVQYTIAGIKLTHENQNLFTQFNGNLYNVNFGVELNVIDAKDNVGVIDYLNISTKLVNVSVNLTGTIRSNNNDVFVGGLAGTNASEIKYEVYASGSNETVEYETDVYLPAYKVIGAKVSNVKIEGRGNVYFGGLVGKNLGTIIGFKNPLNDISSLGSSVKFEANINEEGKLAIVNIDATNLSGGAVGGLVGLNSYDEGASLRGKIENGWVDGTIKGDDNLGGIVGKNEQKSPRSLVVSMNGTYIRGLGFGGTNNLNSVANLVNTKSSVKLQGDENVGGVVGYDINGAYYHTYYQAIVETETKTTVNIYANNNVGGIVGYSKDGVFDSCSVMSYYWDYSKIDTTFKELAADISGAEYVGGIVGCADSSNTIGEGSLVAIGYSSVNAFVEQRRKTVEDGQIGGIVSVKENNAAVFHSYFIGKLTGNVVYNNGVCVGNKLAVSIGQVYSLNVNTFGTSLEGYNWESIDNADDFWKNVNGINANYNFITIDITENNPIFEISPSSFEVKTKRNAITDKAFYLEYFDFSNLDSADQEALKNIPAYSNTVKLTDFLDFISTGVTSLTVAVSSSNNALATVDNNGNITVLGTGKVVLTFYPILNPTLKQEITLQVVSPITNVVLSENPDSSIPITRFNISKNSSKILYMQTGAVASYGDPANNFNIKAGQHIVLDVSIKAKKKNYSVLPSDPDYQPYDLTVKIDDYLSIPNFTYDVAHNTYSGRVSYEDMFSIKVKNHKDDVYFEFTFNVNFKLRNENNIDTIFEKSITIGSIELDTHEGPTSVVLSQSFAYVYPKDEIFFTAYVYTDIVLTESQLKGADSLIKQELTKFGGEDVATCEFVSRETTLIDGKIQVVTYKLTINKEEFKDPFDMDLKFMINSLEVAKIEYTILPQRIDYLEIKNFTQKSKYDVVEDKYFIELTMSDVLRPATKDNSNAGIITIDVSPNNGYYDYLEIKDITGQEEIKFIQVVKTVAGNKEVWKAVSLEGSETSDGLGIKLLKQLGDTKIYVLTQISGSYSTMEHTIQVTAHLNYSNEIISRNTKVIEAKMLPIIKATYILPDGVTENGSVDSSTNEYEITTGKYLANGTTATFRLEVANANEGVFTKVTINDVESDYYTLVHNYGNLYSLQAKPLSDADRATFVGQTLRVEFSVAMVEDDGAVETAYVAYEFKLVEYFVHGVSIASVSGNVINGNYLTETPIKLYFNKTDISYYQGGSFNDVIYDLESKPAGITDGTIEYEIYSLLSEINKSTDYVDLSRTDAKVHLENYLTHWMLTVEEGYSAETKLNVKFELEEKTGGRWTIKTLETPTDTDLTFDYTYDLNFTTRSSRIKPKVITNEDEFKAMVSGKGNYYILGNDLTFEKYVPLDVDICEFDGNGRKITIKSFEDFKEAEIKAGLFKQIYEGMIVKNVVLEYTAGTIDLCAGDDVAYTSARFGGITPLNNGIITNCIVKGSIKVIASKLISTSAGASSYSNDFYIGGVVVENASTGYITHTTTSLDVDAQANIGGFIYKNSGKIASCKVDNIEIRGYPSYAADKTLVTKVAGFVVENTSNATNSYTGKGSADITMCAVEFSTDKTLMAKDLSAGFVWSNNSTISDCYVLMPKLGTTSNIFSGFVNENAGTITRSYSYINQGTTGNNINMFAPAESDGIVDCLEIVNSLEGYSSFVNSGLKTIEIGDRFSRSVYESCNFAFGDNVSAVWSIRTGAMPKLVAVEEMLPEKEYDDMPDDKSTFTGLRNGYRVQSEENEFAYEYEVLLGDYGTKNNPYIITNINHLDGIDDWTDLFTPEEGSTEVNTEKYYRIVTDLDFSKYATNPITSSMVFKGNIQGNGMTINGIILYSEVALDAIGLFKKLEHANDVAVYNAVRNLTLRTNSVWATKTKAVGLLAGISTGFNLYNIHADTAKEIVVGGNAVGSIVGLVNGEFNIEQISTNIGANSTRSTQSYRYAIYTSVNNKQPENNLGNVYYAGAAFGIVDGYFGSAYDVHASRDILRDKFSSIKNVYAYGDVTVIGDTAGGVIGLVTERTYASKIKALLTGGKLAGDKYSAGLIGELRGVLDNSYFEALLVDEETKEEVNVFSNVSLATGGAVGLNLGGLIQNVSVNANVVNTNTNTTVGGVVARNVAGTINDLTFNGKAKGYYTGIVVGSDYSSKMYSNWSSTGAMGDEYRQHEYLLPSQDIVYRYNNVNLPTYSNIVIGKDAMTYLLNNVRKNYTFANTESFKSSANAVYVYGVFIGFTDKEIPLNSVDYTTGKQAIVINGSSNSENLAKIRSYKVESVDTGYLQSSDTATMETGYLYALDGQDFVDKKLEKYLLLTYIVGANVTNFDSWDRTYSTKMLAFTKNNDGCYAELTEITETASNSYKLTIKNHNIDTNVSLEFVMSSFGFDKDTSVTITTDGKTAITETNNYVYETITESGKYLNFTFTGTRKGEAYIFRVEFN